MPFATIWTWWLRRIIITRITITPSTCTNGGLSSSSCAGTLDFASAMIDYRVTKRLDMYAGVMWSKVAGGLASGYLNFQNVGPTAGLRFQF